MTKKIIAFLLFILMTFTALIGCNVASVDDPYEKIIAGDLPARNPDKEYGQLTRYDETVTVKVIAIDYPSIGEVPSTYNGRPIGPSNNAFNDAALLKLNIKLDYVTTVSGESYEQRLNTLIAANDLPDVFITSSASTFDSLRKSKLIADLGDVFYYLNDEIQEMYLSSTYKASLESCMEQGGLYALPNVSNPNESAQKLYIRQDWLKIVNMSAPTTYEELVAVAKAFKDNASTIAKTMQGVSASDIIPIGLTKEISTTGNHTAQGFFNMFGVQPDAFFEKDGKLYASNTSEEMKNALAEFSKLYSDGLISKEFYNHTHSKVSNDIVAGKVGMISGMWHVASYPLQDSVNNEYTPSAEWVAVELPSYNGKAALPVVNRVSIQNYNMVSRSSKNPEAVAKLINLFHDMFYSNTAEETYGSLATPQGGFFYSWVPIKVWYTPYSTQSYYRILEVFNELHDSGFRLSAEKLAQMESDAFDWKTYYNSISADETYGAIFNKLLSREHENGFKYGYPYFQAIKAGKSNAEMTTIEKRGYGIYEQAISSTGGYAYVVDLTEGKKPARYSEFFGIKTPAQQTYDEYLQTSMKSYFLQVISGRESLDKFSQFVSDYNKNGGTAVINQLNQWFAN